MGSVSIGIDPSGTDPGGIDPSGTGVVRTLTTNGVTQRIATSPRLYPFAMLVSHPTRDPAASRRYGRRRA